MKKGFKVFFFDTGVRNALVDIASSMDRRADRGGIFENFFVSERMKKGTLEIFPPELMFWKSRLGYEIDVIEKSGATIFAFECKWSDEDVSFSDFLKKYPHASTQLITPHVLLAL